VQGLVGQTSHKVWPNRTAPKASHSSSTHTASRPGGMHRCYETRTEGGCAGFEHGTRGLLDVRVSGSVQVLERGVGLPATQELGGIGVDIGNEEGGSAASAKRAGLDLGWLDLDAIRAVNDETASQRPFDARRVDRLCCGGVGIVLARTERGVVRTPMGDWAADPADQGGDRASEGVPGTTVSDNLPSDLPQSWGAALAQGRERQARHSTTVPGLARLVRQVGRRPWQEGLVVGETGVIGRACG